MTTADLAWLVGILEGEGCFTVGGSGGICVQVAMTDEDVIERVSWLLNASIETEPHQGKRTMYKVRLYGDKAERIMRLVYAYMGYRRQARIRELLAKRGARRAHQGNIEPL